MENKVYRTELNPVSFLRRSAYVYPDRVAISHGARRISYRQMEERVDRFAAQLRAERLSKGDRVAVLLPNIPAMAEAHFAVPAAGGVLVTLNTRLSAFELQTILAHCGATVLLVDDELWPSVASLDLAGMRIVHVADTGAADDPYEAWLAGAPWTGPVESWLEDEEETISINYTSGTTGQPKGVMYTYRGAALNALANVIETHLTAESTYLWTLPMFHCNGWCYPWSLAAVGARAVCLRRVDFGRIWELFESESISHYCGAPTVQIGIVGHPKARRLERPITIGVAAAPPSPTLLAQMVALNLQPTHVYGLTETYGPTTVREPQDAWKDMPLEAQATQRAQQGQGNVLSDLVRVVDLNMADVPRDGETLGEVVMRGNIVMKGYYNAPDMTADSFRGGWFHSGDVAVWHPDGNIELRDRKKDIIISGGENISTIEVEQALASHPAVLECAVVSIPDDKWGERPKAFVTLKEGASVTAEDLIAHCRQRLAGFKIPAAVEFGPLPKTSTGKVQKFTLREREWGGRTKRIN